MVSSQHSIRTCLGLTIWRLAALTLHEKEPEQKWAGYQTMNDNALMARDEGQRNINSDSDNRPAALYREMLQRVMEVSEQIQQRIGKVIENGPPNPPG